ncbi:MAG: hypothetical protein V1484_00675 [bacterium]
MVRKSIFKITIGMSVIMLFALYFYFFSSPYSVKSFGPLKLGDHTPVTSDVVVEYEPFYDLEYKFYIYAMEKGMSFCAQGDCGMSGVLVDCLGGWLSGQGISGDGGASDYGLAEEEVASGKSSIIMVADKDKKIIGIYPNSRIRNIPYILKNHLNLSEDFNFCYDVQMPKRH